jgi:dTDP-L-rhamnose 4-epimerase
MRGHYLVTGGAGFIGRHLCEELLAQGHKVRALDSLIDQVHGDAPPDLHPDVELLEGDVRDPALLDQALQNIDGVFHLAAEVGVGQSMYEISRYVGANDLGTAILLERLVASKTRRIVVASSMSVYGEGLYATADGKRHGDVRRPLTDSMNGWDPRTADGDTLHPIPTDELKTTDLASVYAVTKYVQERNCLIVGRAYGIDAVALRLFNVFGPGQALSNPYTGVLANFGARLLNGERPLVFEDGQQKRDFVHVRDVARAFRLAMEHPDAAGHVINVGSGHAYTVAEVANILARAMHVPHLGPQLLGKARKGDIRHCFADITKARTLLGFQPTHFLEDTVGELAQWIGAQAAHDKGEDAKRQLEARGLVA